MILNLYLAAEEDSPRIQAVLDQAPTYTMNTEGVPMSPSGAQETLRTIPPGFSFDRKRVFLIQSGGEDVGVADVLEGFPSQGIAFIGLLLLAEPHQGKGLGAQAYQLLEAYVKQNGLARVQIAVVDSNPVEKFWEKMGFLRTGKTSPHIGQKVQSVKRVMEKRLTPR